MKIGFLIEININEYKRIETNAAYAGVPHSFFHDNKDINNKLLNTIE